jgi:hemin uptake protein HemP
MENPEPIRTRAAGGQHSTAVPLHIELPRRVTSTSLLQGQRQIVIEHAGREYRLHLTSKGKLILTG